MKLLKNRFFLILGLVLIAIIVFFVIRSRGKGSQKSQFQTQKVERGTVVSSVSASGQVVSSNNLVVVTNASGVIKNVYVKNGDKVAVGQKIMDLELDQPGLLRQAQAWSVYLGAKNSLATAQQAKLSFLATLETDKSKLITAQINADGTDNWDPTDKNKQKIDSDRRNAELNFQIDQQKTYQTGVSIQKAQVDLNSAYLSYQSSANTVYAPSAGIVADLILAPGLSVNTSAGSNSNTTTGVASQKVAAIKSAGQPILSVNISEIDATKIKPGQKATITVDALPNQTFTGLVVGIDQSGTVSSGVTNYPATVRLDTQPEKLLTNMAGTAKIILEIKSDVLLIPTSAIMNQSGQNLARLLKNGQEEDVPVEIGLAGDSQTEIVSGLTEGEEVIIGTTTNASPAGRTGSIFGAIGGGRGFGGGSGGAAVLRRD